MGSWSNTSIVPLLQKRETDSKHGRIVKKTCQFTDRLIKRLGLEGELEGHRGCVNCLQWNSKGSLLASGSDDTTVIIWDPFRQKCVQNVSTPHIGNIFSVKFLGSNDSLLATAAGDCGVVVQSCLEGAGRSSPLLDCSCHVGRVKRLATAPEQPLLFWSAGEDGLVIQYDLREPHVCSLQSSLLINLSYAYEIKCIAVNPTKPHYIAVGCDDCFVRLYDRRMMQTISYKSYVDNNADRTKRTPHPEDPNCVQYYAPGHLARDNGLENSFKLAATYITFNAAGSEMLVNLGGEQIYLFDVNNARNTNIMHVPQEVVKRKRNGITKHCCCDDVTVLHTKSKKLNGNSCACDYINRATKLYQRKWIGDLYSAARDYLHVIRQWPDHTEAYLGLIRCLVTLKWPHEAAGWLEYFCKTYPDYEDHDEVVKVKVILDVLNNSKQEEENDSERAAEAVLSDVEKQLRMEARDYELRFVGHCNTTTDIKEANFLGEEGKYICAGSDDGIIFFWDRETTEIIHAVVGDTSIVNCIQPHANACFVASSGIDSAVKLWSPLKEDGTVNKALVPDLQTAVSTNQARMSMDPFETLLANMGYRVRENVEGPLHEVLTCRTS